ncbi:MAG: chromosomal replication initiator protein DnaA [Rickettsiales bacterium]|nr:chromosomal replication initiator protein DnaA [Rickettsiales bacterium]
MSTGAIAWKDECLRPAAASAANRDASVRNEKVWLEIQDTVQKSVPAREYSAWLAPLCFDKIDLGTLYLKSPTRFIADWVRRNYSSLLLSAAADFGVEKLSVSVGTLMAANDSPAEKNEAEAARAAPEIAGPANSGMIGSKVAGRCTLEDFMDSPGNTLASAAIRRMLAEPHPSYNPVLIHSDSGLGKSHLLQAFANAAEGRRVIYTTADGFINGFVKALQDKEVFRFKEDFKSADVLLVDDVHHFVGKESSARELFHIIDFYVSTGKQVVLSANASPFKIEGLNESLKSRICHGLILDIAPADYDLRLKFINARAAALELKFQDGVAEFLASKISASIRELEGAVNRLSAHSVLLGEMPTMGNIRKTLADILAYNTKPVAIADIKKAVAEAWNITVADIDSTRKQQSIAVPRQVAMYIAKNATSKSLPELGRAFSRDHATIIYAIKKVQTLIATNPKLAEIIEDIEKRVG